MSGKPVPAREPEVFSITAAHQSLTEDQSSRTRRYLFSMILRTLCFVGAVVASGWLRWVLIVGAVFLPYIAVFIANAGRETLRMPRRSRPTGGPEIGPGSPVSGG